MDKIKLEDLKGRFTFGKGMSCPAKLSFKDQVRDGMILVSSDLLKYILPMDTPLVDRVATCFDKKLLIFFPGTYGMGGFLSAPKDCLDFHHLPSLGWS